MNRERLHLGALRGINSAFWVIAPFTMLFVIWQAVSSAGIFPQMILPSPSSVLQAGIRQWQSGILLDDIAVSVTRLFLGFAIGAGLGMALGILLAINRNISLYADPVISFFQSIGGIAWVPIAVLWFGFGWGSILFVIANTVFFIVLMNTLTGVETVPQNLVNSVRTLGGDRLTIVREVLIPGALPSIMNGIRVGMGLGWRALIAAEMIAATKGLGFRIFDAASYWKSDQILLGLIVIGTLWAATDNLLLRNLERKTVERWGMVGTHE